MADYNQVRDDFALPRVTEFADITNDVDVASALSLAYDGNVDNVDPFAGAISEDHVAGGSVGELMKTVLLDQFRRSRDGDRFYFENVFAGGELREIRNTRLADIIRRNTGLQNVQDEVFRSDRVLTYRQDRGRANLFLRVQDGDLHVLSRGRVVSDQALVDTDILTIFGSDWHDQIRIDSSVSTEFNGSIEIHGGDQYDSLIIEGTAEDDTIRLESTAGYINVADDKGLSVFFGNSIEHIKVCAGNGNDWVSVQEVNDAVTVDLVLSGGRGDDILIGGTGRETILGGPGDDLLVGGASSDLLFGNGGQDLLVAGNADGNLTQVQVIWTSGAAYSDRLDLISQAMSTIDDGARDYLFGGLARDWILADPLDLNFDQWWVRAGDQLRR